MAYTYEDVIPTLIENTTMQKRLLNGVHRTYLITANAGYVLHDTISDWDEPNLETGEFTHHLGYTTGTTTCPANYDFVANPREFYAVPESSEFDPIPYASNMVLEQGKYYTQDGAVYRCIRDTVSPVYAALRELVGLYVEEVSEA